MRTTIDLKDDLRARLLQIAARRGEKGFSKLIEEAVEAYLARSLADEQLRAKALALKGALGKKEADRLHAAVADARERWR
jgi:predicted transcriptional regulator